VIVPKYEKAGVKKSLGFGPACLAKRWGEAPLINNATLRRAMKRSIGAWRAANPLEREFAGAEA